MYLSLHGGPMAIDVRPATVFDDVATIVGPKRPDANVCWCLRKKVDLTMAYVGTRALFERAGFHKAADTSSVLSGFPRVVMRLDLR